MDRAPQLLSNTVAIPQSERYISGKKGGTFWPCVRCLIQKNDIESLKHESSRRDAEMGQIYIVLVNQLRQHENLWKLRTFQKARQKKRMVAVMMGEYS